MNGVSLSSVRGSHWNMWRGVLGIVSPAVLDEPDSTSANLSVK